MAAAVADAAIAEAAASNTDVAGYALFGTSGINIDLLNYELKFMIFTNNTSIWTNWSIISSFILRKKIGRLRLVMGAWWSLTPILLLDL